MPILKNGTYKPSHGTVENFRYIPQILKRDNYQCVDCGKQQGRLLVHHLDESRSNGWRSMNNDPSNLVTLCGRCHQIRHHKIPAEALKRRSDAHNLYQQGQTYEQIGEAFGVSRQRAYQLVKKYDPTIDIVRIS